MTASPDPARQIADAERSAADARERLTGTLSALQLKLNPRRLARQAMRDATERGSSAAMAGLESARRNPGATAGISAVAGLFLARRRIASLFRRRKKRASDIAMPAGPIAPFNPDGGYPTAS